MLQLHRSTAGSKGSSYRTSEAPRTNSVATALNLRRICTIQLYSYQKVVGRNRENWVSGVTNCTVPEGYVKGTPCATNYARVCSARTESREFFTHTAILRLERVSQLQFRFSYTCIWLPPCIQQLASLSQLQNPSLDASTNPDGRLWVLDGEIVLRCTKIHAQRTH